MHTLDDILRASAAWVWFPRDSEQEKTHLQLVRYPRRFGGGVRGSQVESTGDAATVLDHAIDRTRAWGESQLTFWTNASDRPDLEDELRRRGAEHVDTVTVLALAIDELEIEVPDDATAEIVRTLDQVREVDSINVPVWEQSPLDGDGLQIELDEVTTGLVSGRACAYSAASTDKRSAPAAAQSSMASRGCGVRQRLSNFAVAACTGQFWRSGCAQAPSSARRRRSSRVASPPLRRSSPEPVSRTTATSARTAWSFPRCQSCSGFDESRCRVH